MTKLTREDIFGPTILPGFNGVGEINLEEFVGKLEIPELDGYQFSHLGSLDLQVDVDESDEKWLNDAIREEGNTDDRIEQLENNYEIKEIPIVTRYGNERSSTHLNYAIRFFFKSIFS